MQRLCLKERDAFPRSADEHAQQVMRLLQHRRAVMDAEWAELEGGWKAHSERMVTLEVRPRTNEESVLKLNVGGSNVNVRWLLLAEAEGFEDSILGALLEGVWSKGRIPRDADGRIVLDESPACTNHIIHTMLTGHASSVVAGLPESAAHSAVAIDEVPCLIYTAHVMGLPGYVPMHPRYLKVNGGSTTLEPFEIAPLGAKIREWVGGSCTEHLTLIYRATRDGFDTKSFKPTCDEDTTSHVVSLVRVSSGKENGDDSVVGGYSVLPWGKGMKSEQTIAQETFLFMLKDGSATGKDPSKPVKWNLNPKHVGDIVTMVEGVGACVGAADMFTNLYGTSGGCLLRTGREKFDIAEGSSFLALNGNKVVDVEVYRCSTPDPPATTATSTNKADGDAFTDAEAHDIDSFGRSIANSLMEERVVLDRAVKEMEAAGARVSAAISALQTVYGPIVAAGEQDTVVELNVRGTRMTTLRSTLQACPRSALAVMFNEERWPATDKDKDGHGGRLIDCDTACFSKILDVLRMRKQASWSRGVEEGGKEEEEEKEKGAGGGQEKEKESRTGGSGAVLIKEADAEAFGEVVNMYFPGCESFIMDMVQSVSPVIAIHMI